jgi:hypothetical protein
MPPVDRLVPRFLAEPPQEALPYGRWAERLAHEFLAACMALEREQPDLGTPGEIAWYPDRTWHGRTYIPATSLTSEGYELFGFVRFVPSEEGGEPSELVAQADFTDQTAEQNPDWQLDLCDEVIGRWRGQPGAAAAMTLVWGRPLISGGRVATAELGEVTVDQCQVIEERFTLLAPDDYLHDLLEIKLFGAKGQELARESLYEGDDEDSANGEREPNAEE